MRGVHSTLWFNVTQLLLLITGWRHELVLLWRWLWKWVQNTLATDWLARSHVWAFLCKLLELICPLDRGFLYSFVLLATENAFCPSRLLLLHSLTNWNTLSFNFYTYWILGWASCLEHFSHSASWLQETNDVVIFALWWCCFIILWWLFFGRSCCWWFGSCLTHRFWSLLEGHAQTASSWWGNIRLNLLKFTVATCFTWLIVKLAHTAVTQFGCYSSTQTWTCIVTNTVREWCIHGDTVSKFLFWDEINSLRVEND